MPIYQGLSTKNKAEIIINSQQMGKVYVGDRLVWKKPSGIFYPVYGVMYNYFAVVDSRKLTSSDDWIVPVAASDHYYNLMRYIDPTGTYKSNTAGPHLKDTGSSYWFNDNGLNTYGFNLKPAGIRDSGFNSVRSSIHLWCVGEHSSTIALTNNVNNTGGTFFLSRATQKVYGAKTAGLSIRLLKTSTSLSHGETGTYTGNDGKVYRTICINAQEWLADNLAETKYRNGDVISFEGANSGYYTDAEWDALSIGARCYYNNDPNNE